MVTSQLAPGQPFTRFIQLVLVPLVRPSDTLGYGRLILPSYPL
jgi:hypothetical protein